MSSPVTVHITAGKDDDSALCGAVRAEGAIWSTLEGIANNDSAFADGTLALCPACDQAIQPFLTTAWD